MRRPFDVILMLALTAPAAACSAWGSSPSVITTRPSITEAYEGDQIDQANQKAADYCKAQGLNPMLRITSVRDGTQYATYECTRNVRRVTPE